MKKIILILAIILSVFGVLIIASPTLLKLTGFDEPIKRYLISKLTDSTDHQIDIQRLSIGLNTIDITNATFVSGDEKFKILIEKIRFGFNFWELFSHPLQPYKTVSSITLYRPRLIIRQNETDIVAEKSNLPDSVNFEEKLIREISALHSIKSILIREGRLIWKTKQGEYIAYAQNLDGWLRTEDFNNIRIEATGNLLSATDDNFKLTSLVNLEEKKIRTKLELLDYQINNSLLPHFTNEIYVAMGVLDGELIFDNSGFSLDSLVVNGNLNVQNLNFTLDNNEFHNVNFKIDIKNNHLIANGGKGLLFDAPFLFKTEIQNLTDPTFSGTLNISNLAIKNFEKYIETPQFNGSRFNLDINYSLSANDQQADVTLASKSITFLKTPISEFKAQLKILKDKIEIQKVSWRSADLEFSTKGNYDFSQEMLNISLRGRDDLGEHMIFDRLSKKEQNLSLDLSLDIAQKKAMGSWSYSIAGDKDTLLYVGGDLVGTDESLVLRLLRSNDANLRASFRIDDYLSAPVISVAELRNFPFERFTSEPFVHDLLNRFGTDIKLSGSINNLKGNISVVDQQSANTIFQLNTSIGNLLKAHRQISGDIELRQLTGGFDFDLSSDFLGGSFEFPEGINGELYLDLTKDEQLSGRINITDFNVIQAFTDSKFKDDFRLQGSINGNVEISGTFSDPKFHAHLYGDKFVFNEIGYYQTEVNLFADKTKISLDDINITLNNVSILQGEAALSVLNNQINGYLYGSEIDVEQMLATFIDEKSSISGTGSYSMRLSGTVLSPQIDASVHLNDGSIGEIGFDSLNVTLRDNVIDDGNVYDYTDHRIFLENFYLARQGQYHLNSVGTFPLNSADEINVALKFDGDLLGLLHYWQPFFEDGASLCDVSLKITGTPDNLKFESGRIQIERGELWLKNVVRHIQNINGTIELKDGTNEVNIINLKASVGQDTLTLNSVRDIVTSSKRKLEDWYFKGIDLNFGILKMETTGKGVELNIPGLMYPADRGQLEVSGKSDGEYFYFAGPVRHPLAYGVVTVYNARLTFPFLIESDEHSEPSTVVQFLSNMEWDIHVKSGEDVLYTRDIPAYIDNVHAELFVDESSVGLDFSGILNKDNLRAAGNLTSTRGSLEYLDQNFRVDRFTVDFTKYDIFPDVSGRAWTAIRDTVGDIPKTIYLQLYVVDPETGQEQQRGSWEDFKFKLVSYDNNVGETQEQVLGYLGYSVDNIKEKATSVGGAVTERFLIRPLLRPIERALERSLGMDLVRFNSSIAKNLFYSSLGAQNDLQNGSSYINPFSTSAPYLFLMQSSEVTVGKYLTQNLYLSYTGQLVSVYDQSETGFDMNHSVGIEYRFLRNVLLEIEYDRELMGYYQVLKERQYLEDFKIRLRHSFSF
ncbi:MAG: hypothetical protein AB7T22_01980 [Calditrichaceae bacterium]